MSKKAKKRFVCLGLALLLVLPMGGNVFGDGLPETEVNILTSDALTQTGELNDTLERAYLIEWPEGENLVSVQGDTSVLQDQLPDVGYVGLCYKFVAEQGGEYIIQLDSPLSYMECGLLDENITYLGMTSTNADAIRVTLEEGQLYYIDVSHSCYEACGPFTVTITKPDTLNDTKEKAVLLNWPEGENQISVQGDTSIFPPMDPLYNKGLWYEFVAGQSTEYTILLECDLSLYMLCRLKDANGSQIAYAYSGDGDPAGTIRATLEAGKHYYVEVYHDFYAYAPFTLTITGPAKLNDTKANATLINWSAGTNQVSVQGDTSIFLELLEDPSYDYNNGLWYEFVPDRTGVYKLHIDSSCFAMDCRLKDANGTQLTHTYTDNTDPSAGTILANLEAGKHYYIEMYHDWIAYGPFTLTIIAPGGF